VVVANNEFNAQRLGVLNLFHGLNAAVQGDDQRIFLIVCVINALMGNAIPFAVSVGNVISDVGGVLLQKLENECHRGRAVHVVITINQNALLVF